MKPKILRTFEYSAGGIVTLNDKLLLIQVRNLAGRAIWTFPKGLIDKGENSPMAALREVEEETGYPCQIIKPLTTVRYSFMRNAKLVSKYVRWFWMRPIGPATPFDRNEVLRVRWMGPAAAREFLAYASDIKLLSMVVRKMARKTSGNE